MSLDAFARSDATKVLEIAHMDEEVDEQYQMTTRQLITFMLEDPRTITMALEVLFVSKAIERIGDHAKNISEYVVYKFDLKTIKFVERALCITVQTQHLIDIRLYEVICTERKSNNDEPVRGAKSHRIAIAAPYRFQDLIILFCELGCALEQILLFRCHAD